MLHRNLIQVVKRCKSHLERSIFVVQTPILATWYVRRSNLNFRPNLELLFVGTRMSSNFLSLYSFLNIITPTLPLVPSSYLLIETKPRTLLRYPYLTSPHSTFKHAAFAARPLSSQNFQSVSFLLPCDTTRQPLSHVLHVFQHIILQSLRLQ